MSTELETSWCSGCKMRTTWKFARANSKRQTCQGCGTHFPCSHACKHADCQEARGELVADADGVLRPTAKAQPPAVSEPPAAGDAGST